MTTVDFGHAHTRHWRDAEILVCRRRFANADQLYGLSAECGLKAVMQAVGKGCPPRKHVRELWPEFKDAANGAKLHWFLRRLPPGNPFDDWSHDDRYAPTGHVRKDTVERHRAAALRIVRMIKIARKDGRL